MGVDSVCIELLAGVQICDLQLTLVHPCTCVIFPDRHRGAFRTAGLGAGSLRKAFVRRVKNIIHDYLISVLEIKE